MEMISWGAGLVDGDRRHLVILVSGFLYPNHKEFHFLRFGERLGQAKLFLRDDSPRQFRGGIPGVTESEEENVQFLGYMIDKIGPERVSIVSGSVGTHPAVLWGHWLGVDDIYLVGPVTDMVSMIETDRAQHPSFIGLTREVEGLTERGYPYLSLRGFMQEHADAVKSVDIYYGAQDPIDRAQAATIEDLPQVRSTAYRSGDHFRVPVFALRRDPDIVDRLSAPTVERPADLRRVGPVPEVDLGYAVMRVL